MAAEELYDFEKIVPAAVKAMFNANNLTASTIDDDPELQKARPRVDVVFKVLGEATPKRLAVLDDGSKRTSCFRGELKLHVITGADIAGKSHHSTYRSLVRALVGGLQDSLNGSYLARHKIQFVTSGNEETGIRTQDGFQQTTFPFVVDISIQNDAWHLL